VQLGVRIAERRLVYQSALPEIESVVDLLWDTALRIEDQGTSQAAEDLRQARQNLEKALENGASDMELAKKMHDFEKALREYLNKLSAQAGDSQARGTDTRTGKELTRQDLENFMNNLRQSVAGGQKEQATALLEQMQEMLENLQMQSAGGLSKAEMRQARQAFEKLKSLESQQQDLMDETRMKTDSSGALSAGNAQTIGTRQRALKQEMESALKELGRIFRHDFGKGSFEKAGQEMSQATQSLTEGQGGWAAQAQQRALEELQAGMEELKNEGNNGMAAGQDRFDPLGRLQTGRGLFDRTIEIPDQADRRKIQEIQNELRQRMGQPDRSPAEREYLKRLLSVF
jgi:hypothetical protein